MTIMTAERAAIAAKFPKQIQAMLETVDLDAILMTIRPDIEVKTVPTAQTVRFFVQYHPSVFDYLLPERTVNVPVRIYKTVLTPHGPRFSSHDQTFALSSFGETKWVTDVPTVTYEFIEVAADPDWTIRETNEANNSARYPEWIR